MDPSDFKIKKLNIRVTTIRVAHFSLAFRIFKVPNPRENPF
jgi:hypothetical protein